ncbi:MAG: iron uptake transporter permease EfeU [Candidatus Heimdallarchaeota archaeon]
MVLASFVIALREGIEAALIIGVILAYLKKIQQTRYNKHVYLGLGLAIVISIVASFGFELLAGGFAGANEEVFEGLTSLIAVVVLTYMIFWMDRNSRRLKGELQEKIDLAITQRQLYGLVSLAFFAVFREGLETVLFLAGVRFTTESLQETLIGGSLGLLVAAILGYLFIRGSVEINLRKFFRITGVVLLIFAAGLFAFGVHELIEAGWLPPGLGGKRVYDISHLLSDKSIVGSLLRALVGYNDNPFFWEAIAYLIFWITIGMMLIWLNRRTTPSRTALTA